MMPKIANFVRARPVTILFIALVSVSLFVHLSHRIDHFQECDSTYVYEALHNFPVASLSFNSYVSHGSFISPEWAREILSSEPAKALMSFYRERYGVTDEEEFSARVTRALTRLNPVTAFRAAYIAALSQIPAPFFAKSFFALPTATTYSPGAGFLFGVFSNGETSYDNFMSRGTFITLALFGISAVLLYFTSRMAGVSPLVGAILGTVFLFSISIYSYAYHLGSTIFNVASAFVWMWFFVKYWNTPAFLRKMSLVTAIAFLFNYFIALYWLALAIFSIHKMFKESERPLTPKTFLGKAVAFLKTQKLALASFFFVGLFFYPPGESFRGLVSIKLLPALFYKVVLNFFGFYNHGPVFNFIQFGLAFILFIFALRNIFSKKIERTSSRFALYRFAAALALVYLALVLAHTLAFFPSRHILVFAAPIFLLAALSLQHIVDRLRVAGAPLVLFWIALIALGFSSLFSRISDTKDRFVIGPVDQDTEKVFIYDCAASLSYKDWGINVPVEAIKPASFAPKEGAVYLYASPATSFEEFQKSFMKEKLHATEAFNAEILSESYDTSGACFIGFPPDDMSCGFGGQNQIYKTKFRILPSNTK